MKCYYHQDRDAVALCKSCHRALCPDCAADVPPGTACRGRSCEQEVAEVNLMLERGKSVYQKTGRAHRRNALAFLVMGFVMVACGILPFVLNGDPGTLILSAFGVFFLILALFSFRSGKQIERVDR
jgi:hypothetical protein